MKKILKLLVAIILAVAILAVVTFLIDCSMIKSNKTPVFAKKTGIVNDGGTIEYTGLLYKIIDFNRLNGYDETKIGLWYIEYEDYEEEYKKLDKEIINDNFNNNEDSIDNIENNDILSGDEEVTETTSGDEEIEKIPNESEENNMPSNDIVEEDKEVEEGYYFNATVIGINNNNLVVQALEDEAINASSDMFSFSLPESYGKEYLIGQKVRIKYTGTIRESYPAQIDVTAIDIIE